MLLLAFTPLFRVAGIPMEPLDLGDLPPGSVRIEEVSRTLVHPFTLPRFSMGSVETTGPDRIEPHANPMLDQLFFSFAENDCDLLIDVSTFRFGGNRLLHVPLGSDHGTDAQPSDFVHYLWIDFFKKSEDMQYSLDVHKPVGA
jgi:hypothetical protein